MMVWFRPRSLAAVRRLALDASADTAVEYAALLAVMATTAVVGAEYLGRTSQFVLTQTASAVGGETAAPRPRSAAEGEAAGEIAPADNGWSSVWTVLPLGLALTTSGLVAFAWRQRVRRRDALAEAPAKPAPGGDSGQAPSAEIFVKRQAIFRHMAQDHYGCSTGPLTVGQVMTTRLTTVLPGATRDDLVEEFTRHQFHHLLVCDEAGQLVGIISDRDLAHKEGRLAREIMTPRPSTVTPAAEAIAATSILLERRISCLPVVEADRPVGILTATDLLLTLQCLLRLQDRSFQHDLSDGQACGALELMRRFVEQD